MTKTTVLAALIATSAAVAAYAHGGATGIVKERMDAMSAMGDAVKAIVPMMRGETEYNATTVRSAAETIGNHAGSDLTRLFPEDSGGKPSESKDSVWTNWDEFSEMAERLEIYADGLARAADNGMMSEGQTGMSSTSMMGGSTMMGTDTGMMGGAMMQGNMTADEMAAMPVDGAFAMVSQVCSACHTQFRAESK